MSDNQSNQEDQQQNANIAPPRFGGRASGSSRFGGRSSNQRASAPAQNNPFNRGGQNSSRLGSFSSRFRNNQISWIIRPMNNTVVRFDLNGMGDPFHRLLGTEINLKYGEPEEAVKALVDDTNLSSDLTTLLDEAWASYDVTGAILFYDWREQIKNAFTVPLPASATNNNNQVENDDTDDDKLANNVQSHIQVPTCLRAIDLGLIFNILARVRSNVLISDTPLALEPGFLHRSLVTDDERIVKLVRATGCLEESW